MTTLTISAFELAEKMPTDHAAGSGLVVQGIDEAENLGLSGWQRKWLQTLLQEVDWRFLEGKKVKEVGGLW